MRHRDQSNWQMVRLSTETHALLAELVKRWNASDRSSVYNGARAPGTATMDWAVRRLIRLEERHRERRAESARRRRAARPQKGGA